MESKLRCMSMKCACHQEDACHEEERITAKAQFCANIHIFVFVLDDPARKGNEMFEEVAKIDAYLNSRIACIRCYETHSHPSHPSHPSHTSRRALAISDHMD